MSQDFLETTNTSIVRSTSISLGGSRRLHLQYYKFWNQEKRNYSNYRYRVVESVAGKVLRGAAKIPSKKHMNLLWAKADLEGWGNLSGERVDTPHAIPSG